MPSLTTRLRHVTVLALVLAMAATLFVGAPADATSRRLAGDDRIATAVAVSRDGWTTSDVAVLARSDDPADALAGSALAGKLAAPLLLTPTDHLASTVASELRRLGVARVVLLGGPAALSRDLAAAVGGLGVAVERVAGATRYGTAAAIAQRLRPAAGGTAYLARGWQDALAAAGVSARQAAAGAPVPVLLTADTLPAETAAAISDLKIRTVLAPADMPGAVASAVSQAGATLERLPTADPSRLSTHLADRFHLVGPGPALLVTSARFPDGLGAGAYAARKGATMVLTDASGHAPTAWLQARNGLLGELIGIGGPAAVTDGALDGALVAVGSLLPTSGGSNTGDGLFHTTAEVAEWAARAAAGPYKSAGDVVAGSPGDWDRIRANAAALLDRPGDAIWNGPAEGGLSTCVQRGDSAPPEAGADRIRDAAFVGLVTGDRATTAAARTALLAQARTPGTDLNNTARWCRGLLIEVNPIFGVAQWISKLQLAYDFIGQAAFTATERAQLDRWFAGAADLFVQDLSRGLASNFVDRDGGDYTLAKHRADNPDCSGPGYDRGPEICSLHRHYNNRRSSMALAVALIGAHQDSASLKWEAHRFAQEFLWFGVFPDGSFSEFDRAKDSLPDLGWAYAANAVADIVAIADVLARDGDTSLYELVTSRGAQGSQGGPKSLLGAAKALQSYVSGGYRRTAPVTAADRLIDGRHDGWDAVHDIGVAPGLRYWRDGSVEAVAARSGTGFPARPAGNGPRVPWTGNGGVFPGLMFMFAGMEHVPASYGH